MATKAKYLKYSIEELQDLANKSSSFEEILETIGYNHPNDKRLIKGIQSFFDKANIHYQHLTILKNTEGLVICKVCKQSKPLDDFYFTKGKIGQKTCKECVRKREREKHSRHKDILNDYKKQLSCRKCGDNRHYVLDFHHIDPEQKDYNISDGPRTKMETMLKEIEKCVILCSNCHREFHFLERENDITLEEYLDGV